ncbi:MAG: VOC family protein, partial [Gaiellaceae bacterium]
PTPRSSAGGCSAIFWNGSRMRMTDSADGVVDLIPFLLVGDVERSSAFYGALGFSVVKRYAPRDRLEFAGLEATSAAKIMLARVDDVPETGPGAATPGFLYLYVPDLDAFRERLLRLGIEPDEIEDGPGPGPNRQMCVRDPDGHGHIVAELWPGSVGRDPREPRAA